MSELKVLSKEEVDVLLNLSRDNISEITNIANHSGVHGESWTGNLNLDALKNITELTVAECEKVLTSFFRKKIIVKFKDNVHGKLTECLNNKYEKHVFSVFNIMPNDCYGMVAIDLRFLNEAINILFGGEFNKDNFVIETPGKIGILIAEKMSQIGLDGLKQACSEYGEISCKVIKTITLPNLTSKLIPEEQVFAINMDVFFGEIQTEFTFIIAEKFFEKFIPQNPVESNLVENNLWRTAIETQVVDSVVSVSACLPDFSINAKDLLSLKEGDLIPMSDPTLVYICLNNLKLFRAQAGQANSKRVIKVLQEI